VTNKLIAILLIILMHSGCAFASEKQIILAVGHDHEKMLSPDYPMYNAKWQFIIQSLKELDYTVIAKPLPWARAKHLTQTAKADGLFLAANLPGRDKWAELSRPLGYGVFGSFYHKDNSEKKELIAGIRLGDYDQILSDFASEDLLQVATAHQGFKLLFNKKVDRFVMSESYGVYLLNTELSQYKHHLLFDKNKIEKRSTHIAFSKNSEKSLAALKVVNKAIKLGLEQGIYQTVMAKHDVPKRMQLKY